MWTLNRNTYGKICCKSIFFFHLFCTLLREFLVSLSSRKYSLGTKMFNFFLREISNYLFRKKTKFCRLRKKINGQSDLLFKFMNWKERAVLPGFSKLTLFHMLFKMIQSWHFHSVTKIKKVISYLFLTKSKDTHKFKNTICTNDVWFQM